MFGNYLRGPGTDQGDTPSQDDSRTTALPEDGVPPPAGENDLETVLEEGLV
jgi:hypothetical protein